MAAILAALADDWRTCAEVAAEIGESYGATYRELGRLRESGHVRRVGKGGSTRWGSTGLKRPVATVPLWDRAAAWLAEQYEPVTSADLAAALEVREDDARAALRRLRAEDRAICVGIAAPHAHRAHPYRLWVAA